MPREQQSTGRRRFLSFAGSAAAAALAGCAGGSEGTATREGTATPVPTASETEESTPTGGP